MFCEQNLSAALLKSFGSSLHDIAYAARSVETGSELFIVLTVALYSPSPSTVKSGTPGSKALAAVKKSFADLKKPPPCLR